MIAGVSSILTIFIIVAVGYFFTREGFFDENAGSLFTKIIVNISLPPMIIYSLSTNFSKKELMSSFIYMAIPLACILLCALIGWGAARMVGVLPNRRGLFITMFFASNTIFIGLPVNLALFGEKSVPHLLLFYAVNTTIFWTFGIWLIHKDAGLKGSVFTPENLKKLILNPPFLALVLGFAIVLLQLVLPQFLMNAMKYTGGLTIPLSLLFIGITFRYIRFKDIPFDKEMLVLMAGRFILSPLIVLVLGFIFHLSPLMLKVFVIQSGMPIITQSAISASSCGADYKYATSMVTVSNALSLLFIPLYMFCFTLLGL